MGVVDVVVAGDHEHADAGPREPFELGRHQQVVLLLPVLGQVPADEEEPGAEAPYPGERFPEDLVRLRQELAVPFHVLLEGCPLDPEARVVEMGIADHGEPGGGIRRHRAREQRLCLPARGIPVVEAGARGEQARHDDGRHQTEEPQARHGKSPFLHSTKWQPSDLPLE